MKLIRAALARYLEAFIPFAAICLALLIFSAPFLLAGLASPWFLLLIAPLWPAAYLVFRLAMEWTDSW